MPYFPQSATGINAVSYPVGPTALSLQLTTGSANAKGAYSQFVASSGFACTQVQVLLTNSSGTNGAQFLCDIATGAAASETVVIPNIMAANSTTSAASQLGGLYNLPLGIATATRIAARAQSSSATQTLGVSITLLVGGGCPGITTFTDYGTNTGTSGGTSVDPGGSANTKGSFAQITASLSAVAQSLLVEQTLGSNTGAQTARWFIDVATDAAASEVVLIPDLEFWARDQGAAALATFPPSRQFSTIYIAASTRVATRASCNITDATDRVIAMSMITGTAPAESSGAGAVLASPPAVFVTPTMAGY